MRQKPSARLREAYVNLSGRQIAAIREKTFDALGADRRIDQYTIDAGLTLPDPKDRHVHAAAVDGGMSIVITLDADFIAWADDTLPYEVYTPDEFLVLVDDSAPRVVRRVTELQHEYYAASNPRFNLADRLRRAQAPVFADRIAAHHRRITGC